MVGSMLGPEQMTQSATYSNVQCATAHHLITEKPTPQSLATVERMYQEAIQNSAVREIQIYGQEQQNLSALCNCFSTCCCLIS